MSYKSGAMQSSGASKRRRVLSEIVNTTNSLGFDMANISHMDHGSLLRNRKSETSIPLPPRDKMRQQNGLSLRNNENSRIPTKVDSYIAMNRLLAEKSRIRLPSFQATYEKDRLEEQEQMERHIDELKSELKSADRKLHQTTKELTLLLDANDASQSANRTLQKRRLELQERNFEAQKLFESLETRVHALVAHEELIMHLKLREFENSLQDDYNEAKFQLEEQVKATQFQDSQLVEEGKKLRQRRDELVEKMENTISAKTEALKAEQEAIDAEREKILQEKQTQVESATSEYHMKQERFEAIMREYERFSGEADRRKAIISDISREIEETEQNLRTFDSQKLKKEQELRDLENELRSVHQTDQDWQRKVERAKKEHESAKQKYEHYESTRRILEHAIMGYSRGARLYVRIDQDLTSDNQVVVEGTPYTFDKVMRLDYDPTREWSLLVGEVTTKSDVSVVFSGSVHHPSTHYLVSAFSELRASRLSYELNYTLQSLLVDSSTTDLLNKCTETEISVVGKNLDVISQRMRVENVSDLTTAVKNVEVGEQAVCHILSVDATYGGRTSTHRLFLVNLTNMSIERQIHLLEGSGKGDLATIVSYVGNHTKMVHSCDVRTGDRNIRKLLDAAVTFYR